MIRGIHHVALSTHDLDRMLRFYVEVIGFTPAVEENAWRDDPGIDRVVGLEASAARTRMLRAGGCYLELFEYSAPPPRVGTPLRPCDRGYTHLALDVSDIHAEFRRLREAGMEFVDEKLGDFGDLIALYGRDPEGNIIEIQQTTPDHPFSLQRLQAEPKRHR